MASRGTRHLLQSAAKSKKAGASASPFVEGRNEATSCGFAEIA
jgi:hypothetical protein